MVSAAGKLRRSWKKFFVTFSAISIVVALAGCSGLFSLGESVGQVVGDRLHSDVHKNSASIDFRKVVGGSWTRMLIICGPVSKVAVARALGFAWSPPDGHFELNDSILLFVDSNSVAAHYVGQVDDTLENEEFTPCFPPDYPNSEGSAVIRQIVVLQRSHTVITVTIDRSAIGTIWYISPKERARLASLK